MLPTRGTVAVFLLVRVLLSCQGRGLAGEQRRAVARGDTRECESFVGCGERSRGERIEEGSLGRLWEEGVVPFVFQSNMRECEDSCNGIDRHALLDALLDALLGVAGTSTMHIGCMHPFHRHVVCVQDMRSMQATLGPWQCGNVRLASGLCPGQQRKTTWSCEKDGEGNNITEPFRKMLEISHNLP